MPTVHTVADIQAPCEHVWAVLTDLPSYKRWNPLIREAAGEIAEGVQLELHLRSDAGDETTIRPIVDLVRPERELRWRRSFGNGWIFDSERTVRLEPTGPQSTRLVHWESSSGVLALTVSGRAQEETRRELDMMNDALKQRAERPAGSDMTRRQRVDGRASPSVRLQSGLSSSR